MREGYLWIIEEKKKRSTHNSIYSKTVYQKWLQSIYFYIKTENSLPADTIIKHTEEIFSGYRKMIPDGDGDLRKDHCKLSICG